VVWNSIVNARTFNSLMILFTCSENFISYSFLCFKPKIIVFISQLSMINVPMVYLMGSYMHLSMGYFIVRTSLCNSNHSFQVKK